MNQLDEIKKKQEHEKKHPDSDYFVTYSDVDWLIEQAEILEKERILYDEAIEEDRKTINRLLEEIERYQMMYENTGSIMNRRHQIDKIERYEKALKYISEIKQPDGGYVSRIDVAVTMAKQVLGDK